MNIYNTTAWKWFSTYIKLRDCNPYGLCPTCGKVLIYDNKNKSSNNCDAGHFYSVTYKNIAFNENNVFAQCQQCNRFDYMNNSSHSFHLGKKFADYIEAKIGKNEMLKLEIQSKKLKNWKKFELKEIAKIYREKCKVLNEN